MMSSPPSSSEQAFSGFELLHEQIRYWIWEKGWTELRDAQEAAIPILLPGDHDLIVSAATASGKTEAAFLPILSRILTQKQTDATVLYVSPLKALINDQWDRLASLCENLEIPVIPWHGDVSSSRKTKFVKKPRGIVLITPESLEALFVNKGHQIAGLFKNLQFVVIDEMHSFIDRERGKQLQSLLCRLSAKLQRWVPRVGLSATLGDMDLAAKFLRPSNPEAVRLIISGDGHNSLKIQLRAIEDKLAFPSESDNPPVENSNEEDDDEVSGGLIRLVELLFKTLKGTNNLIFPNRRSQVEVISDLLRRKCEAESVPNEFWPHHGSLSKDLREQTEESLKRGDRPATAVCTSTLEMGIDIGSVKTVAQIGPPPSVASLRQRLGRSGRRPGEAAILRAYEIIHPLDSNMGLIDSLRQDLIRAVASILLLLEKWCEPPRADSLHASTFVQQVLSVIAERGGSSALDLWDVLVKNGAFRTLTKAQFSAILRELGQREILIQETSGLLLHGPLGEKLVNHYTFYTAFANPEEFRVVCDGRPLGTLSVTNVLAKDSRIILAGKRWRVIETYLSEKLVIVKPNAGGKPPAFDSGGAIVHDCVRQKMRLVLADSGAVPFLDATASSAVEAARRAYKESGLAELTAIQEGKEAMLFTWRGDSVNEALVVILAHLGLRASNDGVAVAVAGSLPYVMDALQGITETTWSPVGFLEDAELPPIEKWDWCVPKEVRRECLLTGALDVEGAMAWINTAVASSSMHPKLARYDE
jgi:ATP-dependent Lhr-like helicase